MLQNTNVYRGWRVLLVLALLAETWLPKVRSGANFRCSSNQKSGFNQALVSLSVSKKRTGTKFIFPHAPYYVC
jgi:hypothetical protein